MPAKTKVLVICLDSAEPELLKAWSESGDMPVLKSLREQGLWGDVENTPGFGNGAFWPTLYTGANPGKHGCYFMYQPQPDSYQLRYQVFEEHLGVEPFWSVLSRAGKRVFVADMIEAPLVNDLNGIQLANWMIHRRTGPTASWPADVLPKVIAQYGDDPFVGMAEHLERGPNYFDELYDKLLKRVTAKTDMSCDYLDQGGWDLFVTCFGEPHDVGHIAWHLHDRDHPLHDAETAGRLGDSLKVIYRAIDAAMGRLLEAAGPEATVLVVSGPGMGSNFTATHMMDEILDRLTIGPSQDSQRSIDRIKALYRRLMPLSLRKRVQTMSRRAGVSLDLGERGRRKCYGVPHTDNAGGVRINVVGREPDGRVQPGAEYQEYCSALIRDLEDIVNLDTGKPLVEKVVRTHDICHGDNLDSLPDLLVIWRRDGPIERVGSPKIGELRRAYPGKRSGDHTTRGVVLARGLGIAAGELPEGADLTAIAPTIAALLGVDLTAADSAPVAAMSVGAARQTDGPSATH